MDSKALRKDGVDEAAESSISKRPRESSPMQSAAVDTDEQSASEQALGEVTVRLRMHHRVCRVPVCNDQVSTSTIRSAFLLPGDALLNIRYIINGVNYACRLSHDSFSLPKLWRELQLFVESNKQPTKPQPVAPAPVFDPETLKYICSYGCYFVLPAVKQQTKRLVIPILKRVAITFQHGLNKILEKDSKVDVFVCRTGKSVPTRVVQINEWFDFVVLRTINEEDELSDVDHLTYNNQLEPGKRYTVVGFGIQDQRDDTNRMSLSNGIITTKLSTALFLGTGGGVEADNAGCCWTEDRRLIGMQVPMEAIHRRQRRDLSAHWGGDVVISMEAVYLNIYSIIKEYMSDDDDDRYSYT